MKIGIWNPYLDVKNSAGGGEKYIMDIALFLAREHSVDILVHTPEDMEQVTKRFGYDVSSLHVVPTFLNSHTSLLARWKRSKEYEAMIIVSDGSIPLLASARVYLHIQEPMPHIKLSLLDKIKMQRIKKIFCNSLFTKQYADQSFGKVSEVLYPLVTPLLKEAKKQDMILHVGAFRPLASGGDFKKQAFMITQFQKMCDQGLAKWKFTLACSVRDQDVALFEQLRSTIGEYPIELIANPDRDVLWDLYSKAKIYWHASGFGEDITKHPELVEHFGITTVEAMSAGVVPVVFAGGGQMEIVTEGKNGLLWQSEEELSTKTRRVIEDDELRESMSKAAKERALDFGRAHWEVKVKELFA